MIYFRSYAGEWQHSLFLMEGFVTIAQAANEPFGSCDYGNGVDPKYTLQNVFNSGDGNLSEIFVRWILDRGVTSKEILSGDDLLTTNDSASTSDDTNTDMEIDVEDRSYDRKTTLTEFDLNKFLQACKEYFPMSSRKEVLYCHMAWEYLHRWNQKHKDLTLITEGALPCLRRISQPSIQHRLTSLCWTTFISKVTIEAVNLTENRSSTRCEREIGLQESDLSVFLSAAATILRLLVDSAAVEGDTKDIEILSYDEITLTANISGINLQPKLHLIDHVKGNSRSSDADAIAIQYQFVSVANIIWNFGIDSIKPLSLFNSQESNLFFQGSTSSSTFISSGAFQKLSMFQSDHSRSVRHQRRRFLEAACDGAVACIQQTSDDQIDW